MFHTPVTDGDHCDVNLRPLMSQTKYGRTW